MKRLIAIAILAAIGAGTLGCAGTTGARDVALLAIAGRFQGAGEIRTSGKPFGAGMDTNWYLGSETTANFNGQWNFENPPDWLIELLKGP